MKLNGKICLVTGSGSGMGAAVAKLFGDEGGTIILADINEDAARSISAGIPGSRALYLDVSKSAQAEAVIQNIVSTEGRLDVLVHFAGVDDPAVKQKFATFMESGERLPVGSELSDEQWTRMIDINLSGTFYTVRAALRAMIPNRNGSIVTMSSVAGVDGVIGYAHYCAAKHGVIGLTKSFAKEFIEWGIRINTVAPDPVHTAMSAKTPASLLPKLPIGRFANAQEIARAALFLASDDASYISGETLVLAPGRLTI